MELIKAGEISRTDVAPQVAPIASRTITLGRRTWIDWYANALGVEELPEKNIEVLLALASTAAHASERTAAPLSCWLAATAGIAPADALAVAQELAREPGEDR